MKKILLYLFFIVGISLTSCVKDTPTTSITHTCPSTYTYYYYYYVNGIPYYYMTSYIVYSDSVGCYILYYNYGVLTKWYI